MAQSIQERETELMDELNLFDDWMDKYSYIIELGQGLEGLPAAEKTDENIVRGCQSQVWLTAALEDGKIQFAADSDAIITKGLIGMLTRVLSDQTPADILSAELQFVDHAGIRDHLSPTRSNGLNAMIKKMKLYALAFQAKQNAA